MHVNIKNGKSTVLDRLLKWAFENQLPFFSRWHGQRHVPEPMHPRRAQLSHGAEADGENRFLP
jgi:hypothetical protein